MPRVRRLEALSVFGDLAALLNKTEKSGLFVSYICTIIVVEEIAFV